PLQPLAPKGSPRGRPSRLNLPKGSEPGRPHSQRATEGVGTGATPPAAAPGGVGTGSTPSGDFGGPARKAKQGNGTGSRRAGPSPLAPLPQGEGKRAPRAPMG